MNEKIKETLEKQVQLLSERSRSSANDTELANLSMAMVSLLNILLVLD